jgi:cephalosporin hydroxylase
VFAILESDHSKAHVLSELMAIRPLLSSGDYVIVEDSNINGHPVMPLWGPGPYEAVTDYVKSFPDDYTMDTARENKSASRSLRMASSSGANDL